MAPYIDPKLPRSSWKDSLEIERTQARQCVRMEYIKPLVMLLVGGGAMITYHCFSNRDPDFTGPALAGIYAGILLIQLVFGVTGLLIACKLWLGGAGRLGLGILRLLGIYAIADLVRLGTDAIGLGLVGWLIELAVYVSLLAWLFELEIRDSIVLAVITWVLKLVVGIALVIAFSMV